MCEVGEAVGGRFGDVFAERSRVAARRRSPYIDWEAFLGLDFSGSAVEVLAGLIRFEKNEDTRTSWTRICCQFLCHC